ncbi:hypothetical protein LNP25_20085 [Klebsiella variicola subsp. variicola]|nr:hypothetical protein [Klebsiella variicola subsp. variicola]
MPTKDWIGLIDAPLESEVGRPGLQAVDEGDYTLQLTWNNKQEPFLLPRMGLISTVVSQYWIPADRLLQEWRYRHW